VWSDARQHALPAGSVAALAAAAAAGAAPAGAGKRHPATIADAC
jgi:hypothetical protein